MATRSTPCKRPARPVANSATMAETSVLRLTIIFTSLLRRRRAALVRWQSGEELMPAIGDPDDEARPCEVAFVVVFHVEQNARVILCLKREALHAFCYLGGIELSCLLGRSF